jgi:hypothetical protein
MRSRLALISVFVALSASGQDRGRGKELLSRSPDSVAGYSRAYPNMEILPNGVGFSEAATMPEFYSAHSPEMVGNWFILNGDGTANASGAALTATGSPTVENRLMLPSGANGRMMDMNVLTGLAEQYFATATQASPTGSFSVGMVVYPHIIDSAQSMISKMTTTQVFEMYWGNAKQISWSVYKAGGTVSSTTAFVSLNERVWNVIIGTYEYVGDGTSTLRLYLNGIAVGTPTTTSVGPPAPATTIVRVGSKSAATRVARYVRGAFYTETLLSAATVTAMTNTLLGTLKASNGRAVNTTRNSIINCTNDTWATFQGVDINRPCVATSGLEVAPPTLNPILRSDALDNAAWSTGGGLTLTADQQISPDGTLSMDKVENSGAVQSYRYQSVVVTSSTGPWTSSAWFRATSGTQSARLGQFCETGGVTATCTCTLFDGSACVAEGTGGTSCWINFTATTTPVRATNTMTCSINQTSLWTMVGPNSAGANDNVVVFGVQSETGLQATPYVRTEGTTVTRVIGNHNVAGNGTPLLGGKGCARAKFFTHGIPVGTARILDSTGGNLIRFNATTGVDIRASDGTNLTSPTTLLSATAVGRAVTMRLKYSGATQTLDPMPAEAASGTGTFDGSYGISGGTIWLGTASGGSLGLYGRISDVKFSAATEGCE